MRKKNLKTILEKYEKKEQVSIIYRYKIKHKYYLNFYAKKTVFYKIVFMKIIIFFIYSYFLNLCLAIDTFI